MMVGRAWWAAYWAALVPEPEAAAHMTWFVGSVAALVVGVALALWLLFRVVP